MVSARLPVTITLHTGNQQLLQRDRVAVCMTAYSRQEKKVDIYPEDSWLTRVKSAIMTDSLLWRSAHNYKPECYNKRSAHRYKPESHNKRSAHRYKPECHNKRSAHRYEPECHNRRSAHRYEPECHNNLLTAPRTVSNTIAQLARAQPCANHVQHIKRPSHATYRVPRGTKGQLSY